MLPCNPSDISPWVQYRLPCKAPFCQAQFLSHYLHEAEIKTLLKSFLHVFLPKVQIVTRVFTNIKSYKSLICSLVGDRYCCISLLLHIMAEMENSWLASHIKESLENTEVKTAL